MIEFLFWNCASGLYNKKPYIEKYIASFKPVLFFISECEVTPDQMIELMNVPGYTIEVAKTLESRHKSRLLAYCKNGAGFSRKCDLELDDKNDLIVFGSRELVVIGIYAGFKLFDGESVQGNFDRLLAGLGPICEKFPKVLIGGDFNADPSRPCPKSRSMEIWQTNYGLDQLVTTVTRERLVSGFLQQSMIDLVFQKDLDDISVNVKCSEASDHSIIIVRSPAPTKPKVKFKKEIITDWRNFNAEKMCDDLMESLNDLNHSNPSDILDRDLSMAILASLNRLIPKRVVHIRRETDVVNYHIEAVKKKRDRLLKKARKTNDPKIMACVKELNIVIKKVVIKERNRLIKNKMKNSSSTTFWSTVNTLLGRSARPDAIRIVGQDGSFLNKEETVQEFADFFKGKVEKLINQNPIQDKPVNISYSEIPEFTLEEIQKALKSFKPKKSSGPDEIPLLIYKTCFGPLEKPVHSLFKQITRSGKIPTIWKLARLKPILKKGDSSKVENYRPISNLNSISKLFERCLLNRISHLDIDGPNQHGFLPCHSTTTAAIELQNTLAGALDLNKHCLVYSMDLSAAFDLIRPGIFVEKACSVIKDTGIVWLIHDFITNRKAFVELDSVASCVFSLDVGCPQGSTLGPKVFNIYCNDLYKHVNAHLVSYADDSYVTVTGSNIEELKERSTCVMTKHLEWLKNNGMVCNVSKTEVMVLNAEDVTSITVENRTINCKEEINVLGLTFDSKLTWEAQVSRTISRTNRMLHGLKRIRRFLNTEQAQQVMTSYYFSVLYYGLEVWFHRHLPFNLKQKIRSAHYRALRVIYGDRSRQELDLIGKRATPDEWSDYSVGKLLARTIVSRKPGRLMGEVLSNAYSERRQSGRLFFFDNSSKKIGRQCIKNRLNCISRQMRFKWLETHLDALRPKLKSSFFPYYRSS